jgi:hypothetical protein
MSDAQLEGKFHSMCDRVLGAAQTKTLINACWAVGKAPNVAAVIAAAKNH